MEGSRFRALFLALLFCVSNAAEGVEFEKKNFVLFGYHTQEHLWLSAGGTFIGSQCFQIIGVDRTPADVLSAGIIFGAGMSKEFFIDPHPGVNDIIADSLGVAIGTLANVTIHFDYWGKGKKAKNSNALLTPQPSDLTGDEGALAAGTTRTTHP